MRRGRWLVALAAAAVLLLAAAATAFIWQGGKPATAVELPLEFAAAEVVQPVLTRLRTVVEFSGPLVAPQTAVLRAKAGGTLVALHVTEGSRVKAGQPVARVHQLDIDSRVAEREAQVRSARSLLAQAERTHASNERLSQQNFLSPMALQNSAAALDTARAQLDATLAVLATTRSVLGDAQLVAPIAGIVAKRHVLPGEKVSAEQAVLTVVDLRTLELAGNVGTHEVSRLTVGHPVQVQVEGAALPVDGRVLRIAPVAEAARRSIIVTVAVDNAQEQFRAGPYAIARATVADQGERLTLPLTAITSAAGQDRVWLIEKGRLEQRAVLLGLRDERERRIEVLQGVSAASQVLGARFDNLREGAAAVVLPARPVVVGGR